MNKDNNTVKKLLSGNGSEIPLFKVFMPKDVIPALRQVLFSGYIGQGPRVEQFEKELGTRFANKNNNSRPGALVCRSKKECERGRLLCWYGIDRTDKRMDYRCENGI